MQTPDSYNQLISKVNAFIERYYLNNLLRGLIFLGAGLFSAYLTIVLLEHFGNFNTVLRTVLYYAFILLNLALIALLVIPSLLAYFRLGKTLTHDEAAEIIGEHFTDVKDKLLNTLQLKKQAQQSHQSYQLLEASINQKIAALTPVSFPSAINLGQNKHYLKWVALPLTLIIAISFIAPSILTESTKRLIEHDKHFEPAAPFKFVILNKSLKAVQGADFKLNLKLEGNNLPANVYIQTGNNTFKIDKESLSAFHYTFINLQQNTLFRILANGFSSQPYEIKVGLKPSLLSFDVQLQYPAYLHKTSARLNNAGDLTIPAGATVNWYLHAANSSALKFVIDEQGKQLQPYKEGEFKYNQRIIKATTYSLTPQGKDVNEGDKAQYRINVIADEMPSINVEQKQDSISSKAIYFTGDIHDDHGFTALKFHFNVRKPGNKLQNTVRAVKADLSANQSNFFYYWNLKDLNIEPGAEVSYYFEVTDNDAVTGPKTVRSSERTLQVPTQKELAGQLDANSKATKQKMQSAVKLAAQVERDAQKLNQLLLNKNSLTFEEKKQIEDLLRRKNELNQLVKDIQADNKRDRYNREENQKQSPELQEKQKQMEELLNHVLDEKTQDMLNKLQQMIQKDQKDGARTELSKMQNDNKSLKKELDRMLELYKQLEFEQKLNQNINELQKLAEQQQALSEKTKQPGANMQQLLKEQEELKKNFDGVQKSLNNLKKSNEELEQKNNFNPDEKKQEEINREMDNSRQQLQKNDKSKAASSQQQAAQQMQQMAQKMQQDQQEGEQEENMANAQQLRELLKVLVTSSFEQEKVMQAFKVMSGNDPMYVGMAQKQKNIKDNLKTAEDTLYALSRRIPQIQSTVNQEVTAINTNIDKALELLGDRRTPEANRSQQYAMTAMNNLALLLSEALDNLQNASSKGGKSGKQQSLQQLSQMQQQLNKNMQKMREQMQQQGNQGESAKGQSQQQRNSISEQMARMARQQQLIRQQLQELNRQQNKDGTGKLGNLDKISKEMEQTESDLVNKKITEESLIRQRQIQNRLLDAEKAEQEREQNKQRESRVGIDTPPGYIKALQEYELLKAKQTEQIQTVPPALNFYYKQKIKRYFDQLNAK
ncbi:DUF4175 family protein [Mucilaginibacter aquatilis]|uniref:DUF4175 family protein n=1 Tax=Mucilaginibacter aquatilis TaxID=1517760 RepID=A0A6I4I9C1_9SPHI|nr:DUF4175 family protein [Mucilaginibacter aquatilis]MVN90578.1 hypothetical protein [Mucilaginibacter aquatilis]